MQWWNIILNMSTCHERQKKKIKIDSKLIIHLEFSAEGNKNAGHMQIFPKTLEIDFEKLMKKTN